MLEENEDSCVQSYIQTQNTGIGYETLLMLQLLKCGEMQDCQSVAVGGA